jgi:hypothetical protein
MGVKVRNKLAELEDSKFKETNKYVLGMGNLLVNK